MECMGRKEYPLTQIDGTHSPTQHKLNTVPESYNGRTAERNRTNEGHKREKIKERWQRKGCTDNSHVIQKKNWQIRNSHIDGRSRRHAEIAAV